MSEDSGWEGIVQTGFRYAWLAVAGAIAAALAGVGTWLYYWISPPATPFAALLPTYIVSIPRIAFMFLAMAGLIYIATKLVVAGLYTPWAPLLDERFKKWGHRLVRIGAIAAWALLALECFLTLYNADAMSGARGSGGAGPVLKSVYGFVRAFFGFLGLMTAVLVMKSLLIISERAQEEAQTKEAPRVE